MALVYKKDFTGKWDWQEPDQGTSEEFPGEEVMRYTVRHIKDETGIELPIYPTKVTGSSNLISRSFNNIYGTFLDLPIAEKLKINWIFDASCDYVSKGTGANAGKTYFTDKVVALFSDYIRKKIYEYKSRFFEITSWCPGIGYVKMVAYLGTPTTFNSEGVYSSEIKNNKGASTSFEIHWIEVGDENTKLNDPTKSSIIEQ